MDKRKDRRVSVTVNLSFRFTDELDYVVTTQLVRDLEAFLEDFVERVDGFSQINEVKIKEQ